MKELLKNKKIYIFIITVLIIIIVVLIFKMNEKNNKVEFSIFGNDYQISGLEQSNKNKTIDKSSINTYSVEQNNEELYDFIERRGDYAVINVKGRDLANELNTGGKMLNTSSASNYSNGRGYQMPVNEYLVLYEQGKHFVKILSDINDDKIIDIVYSYGYLDNNSKRDEGMTQIFEKIKSLSNTKEDMTPWSFNYKVTKWYKGEKALYEKGLGVKIEGFYDFHIIACPNRQFYNEYSTNF